MQQKMKCQCEQLFSLTHKFTMLEATEKLLLLGLVSLTPTDDGYGLLPG